MHVLLLTFWSRLQLFVWRMGRNICYSVSFVWQSVKHALSTHNTTSHFTHLDLTVCVTLRSEHMQHRLLVGLQPGQCLLWRVSNLIMFADARTGLPTALDGRGSCPALASISLTRVSQKSLCEIFATVGVAPFLHPLYQMCRIAPRHCRNP